MTQDRPDSLTSNRPRLICVTGPSGAGRSSALRALEDTGYEAIDNMPLGLLQQVLVDAPSQQPVALGVDVRNRDFSAPRLLEAIDQARSSVRGAVELVFLECRPEILIRRYSETRRRHPLGPADDPAAGIARELEVLAGLEAKADVLIDTSELTPHDLRYRMQSLYGQAGDGPMSISVMSFAYKRGLPHSADIVMDCRMLRNPYWSEGLRSLDGRSRKVAEYVTADPNFRPFLDRLLALAEKLLPAYVESGKSHLAFAFGCTGGQHRSVAVAEVFSNTLSAQDWDVSVRHRELERQGVSAEAAGTGDAT